jgi:hypothetical protein
VLGRPVLLAALGLGLTLGACRISNEDHCVHKALEADAWCAENVDGRPFCSPCEADEHGCVAEQPDPGDCPAYTPDSASDTGDATSATGETTY